MELDREIGKIDLSGSGTIGEYLHDIKTSYTALSKRFNYTDSSNPINAYINIHAGTDNFATISLNEKELYKQYCQYQLTRALTILQTYDSPVAYQTKRANFDASLDKWPATDKGARDSKGNPYCYLMEDYVRLATKSEVEEFWSPLHRSAGTYVQVTSKSGKDVRMQDFLKRMNGRTLDQELQLAGIKNISAVKREEYNRTYKGKWWTPPYGLTFRYERWGNPKGYKVYKGYTPEMWVGYGNGTIATTNKLYLHDGDYVIVAPYFMMFWDPYILDPAPGAALYYVDDDSAWNIECPMTTLVPAS